MKNSQSPVSLDEAIAVVLRDARPLPPVEATLDDAVGRVVAEDVISDVDMPPFDKAAMDGYAVRSEDVAAVPAELRVVEEIAAGRMPSRCIGPGECARIMTGAPLPEGADTVVVVEHTEPAGQGRARILRTAAKGLNICFLGEDVSKGQVVLRAGTVLRPFEVALAAAAGRARLRVHGTPRVAVIATGDEVVEPDQTPRAGQIRNSNSYALVARLRRAGLRPDYLGIAPDEREALLSLIGRGLDHDVLVVSGGVSAGDYDLVPEALEELGVELLFRKIAVKPGNPTLFGRRGTALVFGLPGNPVSTLVIGELVLMPALRRLMGERDAWPMMLEATLDGPLSHKGDRVSFRPVLLRWSDGALHAEPVEYHGSADLAGASRGNAFAALPQNVTELAAGSMVRVLCYEQTI